MEPFRSFITEEKNTHMTHIEDKVLYGGVNGTRQAINALRQMRDMAGGYHEGKASIKWDGAPAIFAGTDPNDGEFFVAKKGIFNKNPKVYKTNKDIDDDTSGDLNAKLKLALRHLPKLGIKGVVQGDFLFDKSDIKVKKIHGEKYLTFHPNTIVYAVPMETDKHAVAEIKRAKMGIVWHTTYSGNTFESMKASFGVDVSKFKKSPDVWSQDAMLRDMTKYTMTKKDTADVNKHLRDAGVIFNKISGNVLRELESNKEVARLIETFNNSHVRKGVVITNTGRHVNNLIKWINARYQKEIDKRKTDKGKGAQAKKRDAILEFFSEKNKANLKLIFDLQLHIVLAKLKLINTLNRLKTVGTFVQTKDGFAVTGHEGYVAIDTLTGGAVKIVDRMEFSYNNFSPDIIKGWQKA